ncbi:NitT/TauT family transport system ATP-binding protein [Aquimarina sp. MAR_2010_214]|uniref:ABC transporter ATP-binding protein n=1 Tax=Aquimarina sp. MAR_2010_214 TaxID=1250026 RepID=UPI000C712A57|nr:ABC transporter ATP-binding protein [Aquimarina sp. MAR_2010_214]PKV53096.1 NitT/TauT family transport system ATP-binding protein [Aquimarina sp. MAR_2010_214]
MVQFNDNSDAANIIELRNVFQSYDNGKTNIIENLDLLVEDKPMQGQFTVILGMSGCGKSTLLRYIAGLQEPTSGTVLVKGKPVSKENRVSMVFQQYSSLPWMTVLDNVGLGLRFKGVSKKERDEKAMEMIQLVGLDGHQKKYAQYPTLSGGQLQRVAIARSLMSNPEILLMDEPFGALDVKTRLQMQDLLIGIWEKFSPTILFVTHDIQEAVYLADDIYIMKHAPSQFVKHIDIDLPFQRTRETKRLQHFDELVHEVEDAMMLIDSED